MQALVSVLLLALAGIGEGEEVAGDAAVSLLQLSAHVGKRTRSASEEEWPSFPWQQSDSDAQHAEPVASKASTEKKGKDVTEQQHREDLKESSTGVSKPKPTDEKKSEHKGLGHKQEHKTEIEENSASLDDMQEAFEKSLTHKPEPKIEIKDHSASLDDMQDAFEKYKKDTKDLSLPATDLQQIASKSGKSNSLWPSFPWSQKEGNAVETEAKVKPARAHESNMRENGAKKNTLKDGHHQIPHHSNSKPTYRGKVPVHKDDV